VLLVLFAQILSGGSLCGKSCVDDIVKILLYEGGDVELFDTLKKTRSWLAWTMSILVDIYKRQVKDKLIGLKNV